MKDTTKLIDELNTLPKGYISTKTIKGNVQHYLQWTENGKKKSKYISKNNLESIKKQIKQRKKLEEQISSLPLENKVNDTSFVYTTSNILTGTSLKEFVKSIKTFKKRFIYRELSDYLHSNDQKVFILYGLRRTGKTTLIKQAIANLSNNDFNKAAFIQINKQTKFSNLNNDLKNLQSNGYKYIFIDEVTLMKDFIEGSAILSDIYAASNMKIILSGTDSLGFMISKNYELYDRSYLLHTTYISYKEFNEVLGIKGLDKYIEYGGTMSISGSHCNDSIFDSKESIDEYIDSSIVNNIQHSLKQYQGGSHFRSLYDLYINDELTSAINRIIEDMNHNFTIDVLTRIFKSNDLSLSAHNLRSSNDILDKIDIKTFTNNLKNSLKILNKCEQTIEIKDSHRIEIKEYLILLDLIDEIELRSIQNNSKEQTRVVFSQPAMRYFMAKELIINLLKDDKYNDLSIKDKKQVETRILSEIKGRMLEDIILLETKINNKNKEVFKLQFPIGEYDMVIFNPENVSCEIYEIKHSDKIDKKQYRFLVDEEKLKQTEFKYGDIKRKVVIYNGPNKKIEDIEYINVEEFLIN